MVFLSSFAILMMVSVLSVSAQSQPQGDFFDTYLPIAQLFDSPVFFGIVVGSGVVFFGGAIVFAFLEKRKEARVFEWGESQSREELVTLLGSPVASEAQQAFTYLRKHGDDDLVDTLIYTLQEQRRSGNVNPYCIYLLEDWDAYSAIPVLKQLANGKSKIASTAGRTLALLMARQQEEHNASA